MVPMMSLFPGGYRDPRTARDHAPRRQPRSSQSRTPHPPPLTSRPAPARTPPAPASACAWHPAVPRSWGSACTRHPAVPRAWAHPFRARRPVASDATALAITTSSWRWMGWGLGRGDGPGGRAGTGWGVGARGAGVWVAWGHLWPRSSIGGGKCWWDAVERAVGVAGAVCGVSGGSVARGFSTTILRKLRMVRFCANAIYGPGLWCSFAVLGWSPVSPGHTSIR